MRIIFYIFLCISLLNCTGVSSVPIEDSHTGTDGIPYSVPTTYLPITVTVNETSKSITLDSAQPVYRPDIQHTFRAVSPYNPFFNETATLEVSGGLLTAAKLISDSRLSEIIKEIAGAALSAENLRAEKAAANADKIVFNRDIDVGILSRSKTELGRLNSAIHTSITRYVEHRRSHGEPSFLGGHLNKPIVELHIEKQYSITPEHTSADTLSEDCTIGVCYRIAIPYRISARFFDGAENEMIVNLPNDSPIFALRVRRGLFSDWTTDTTFVNGMPTKLERITTSEIEAIVSLPSDIVGAQIAALTQRGSLADQQRQVIEKERQLDAVRAESAIRTLRAIRLFRFGNSSTTATRRVVVGGPLVGVPNPGNPNPGGLTSPGNPGTGT